MSAATEIVLARGRSRAADVLAHLARCEARFTPPLSARVGLDGYAEKLAARAERFEAWAGAELVGLVAVYCDAADRREAYVTSVSVVPERARRGLARALLGRALAHAEKLGFAGAALEVDRRSAALGLYEALGFRTVGRAGETLRLRLDLAGKDRS